MIAVSSAAVSASSTSFSVSSSSRRASIPRASIVNLECVGELRPLFSGDFLVVLRDGTEVVGSRRHRVALETLLR